MEGFTEGIKTGPDLEQSAKKVGCYTILLLRNSKKESDLASLQQLERSSKRCLAYLFTCIKNKNTKIPSLVHIQDIEEVNAAVNADESVEVNSQLSMICLLIGSSKTKSKYHENIRKQ